MKFVIIILFIFLKAAPLVAQSWVSQFQESLSHRESGQTTEAYNAAKSCLENYLQEDGAVSENYAGILFLLSTICYDSSLYAEGVNYAEKEVSVRLQLDNEQQISLANAYYNLGALQNANQQYKAAEIAFGNALNIYQDYFEKDHADVITTYWKLGTVNMDQEKFSQAYAYFSEGFSKYDFSEITMDFLSAAYDMGKTAMALKKPDEAIKYFLILNDFYVSQGYETSVENIYIVLHLAESYQANKNNTKALAHYDKVLQLSDAAEFKNIRNQALKGKAFNLQALGRNEEATAIYNEEVADEPMAMNNAAAIEYQKGNYQKAEELYIKALNTMLRDTAAYSSDFLEITNNLSGFYLSTGKFDDAEAVLLRAFPIAEEMGLSRESLYASLLIKQGQVKQRKQDFINSEQLLAQAEAILISNSRTNSNTYISLLNNRAALYHEQGNFTAAQRILEEALRKITITESNSNELVGLYINLAALYQEQGNYRGATNLLEEVSDNIRELSGASYANLLQQQASLYIQLGDYKKAEDKLKDAKQALIALFGEGHAQLAMLKVNMARLHQAKGSYAEAEKLFLESVNQLEKELGNEHPDYLSALNSFGVLYQTMGNYSAALKHFEATKNGYAAVYGTYHPGYSTAIENISSTYQLMGEMEKVEPLLKEAIQADKVIYGSDHPKYAVSLHNLAALYQKQGDFEQALPLLQEALLIYERSYGKDHPSYASSLFNLAVVNHESGNFEKAEGLFLETLGIRKRILGEAHPEYSFSLYGLAALYHNKNEFEKARPLYQQAVNQYLFQIEEFFPSLSEKEKSAFYAKIKPVFSSFADFGISYYLQSQDPEILKSLYNMQLSTKAILLNAANKVRNRIFSSGDKELIAKYNEWTALKEQVVKHFSMTADEKLKNSLPELESRINDLEKQLSSQSSLFASTFERQIVDWSDIQNALKGNEAAIEILRINKKFISDSVYYASLILKAGQDAPLAVVLPEGDRMETRFYNYFRNAIKFSEADEISYNIFWKPIQEKINGVKTVFVSSDGIYNKLSLPTLYNKNDGKYLLDVLNIRLVSNTRELVELSTSKETDPQLYAAVFGSPDFNSGTSYNSSIGGDELTRMMGFPTEGIPELPGTRQEAVNLKHILDQNNWSSKIYLEQDASEENFKSEENPFLLHVATHGFFLSDLENEKNKIGLHLNNSETNPLFRSGLLLTGAAKGMNERGSLDSEDGLLTAYEAMNLNLDDTEIVILSACETGLGEIRNGEGVYGLQRSFIVAGANSIMMSLWKVNDETTMELMTHFYEKLLEGKEKFTAFKEAQLMIRSKYDDPYHWGAFIILGK
ncbi:MAG: tetratricopeptide repeat protein [Candidatus Cyclobacteriaceae bacterium M2_1C_046]